jgi:hypothetical protein
MKQFIGFFIDPIRHVSVSYHMIKIMMLATWFMLLNLSSSFALPIAPKPTSGDFVILVSPAKSAADNMNDFAPKPPMVKPITKKLKCKKRFIFLQGVCRPQYG